MAYIYFVLFWMYPPLICSDFIVVPPEMPAPSLYGVTDSETIMIVLPQASESNGPITWYLLVVLPESQKTNYSKPDEDYSFTNDVSHVHVSINQ